MTSRPAPTRPLATALTRLLPAALCVLAAACDSTTFDPFVRTERHFSIYGYLDADADTQYVRIEPLRDSAAAVAGPIDASVILTDLAAGTTTTWRDSVFRYFPNTEGHVFWSAQPLRPGRTYRFEVQRSDGAASAVDVAIPPEPGSPVLEPPAATNGRVLRRLVWPGVQQVAVLDLVYRVKDALGDSTSVREVAVSYRAAYERGAQGVEVTLDLSRDYDPVYNAFGFARGTPAWRVELLGVTLRVASASADWDFVGTSIDAETLALPDRFTNVEGGFGFLGALVRAEHPWSLPPEDVARLGFTNGQE